MKLFLRLGILCAATFFLFTCAPRNASQDWPTYKNNFIHPDGRILDTANNNISHSEGQGYAMLLAVHYNDPLTFDKLYTWTLKNLAVRQDSLFAWRWENGKVTDYNNATDADLLIAWALLRAAKKWNRNDYLESAKKIAQDIRTLCTRESSYGLILLPGLQGFEKDEGTIINLSYWIFPALRELQKIDPAVEWSLLIQSGENLIRQARFGKYQLPPDWLLLSQPLSCAPNFEPAFGYNAVRIPLYILWDNPQSTELLKPFAQFWSDTFACQPTINLQNNRKGFTLSYQGMRAIGLWNQASVEGKKISLDDLPFLSRSESYFSASLLLLTKMALRDLE